VPLPAALATLQGQSATVTYCLPSLLTRFTQSLSTVVAVAAHQPSLDSGGWHKVESQSAHQRRLYLQHGPHDHDLFWSWMP